MIGSAAHSTATLRCLYPIKTWREIWQIATGSTWENIKCPLLTRWEHVGELVEHVVKYKEQWLIVAQNIIDMNNVRRNKNDIGSYIYSYLNEDILYAQDLFVHSYIDEFFDKIFQWYKQMWSRSNRARVLAVDMWINFLSWVVTWWI